MGNKPSTLKNNDANIDEFLLTQMPIFLEKHCVINKNHYMDPVHFLLAFQSFLLAEKIVSASPELFRVTTDWLKYYFHQLDTSQMIYITGSPRYNVLVGASIQKWPGTPETDNRARRMDEIGKF